MTGKLPQKEVVIDNDILRVTINRLLAHYHEQEEAASANRNYIRAHVCVSSRKGLMALVERLNLFLGEEVVV